MKSFFISDLKINKKYLTEAIIAIILAIILNIVLCKITLNNVFIYNYAAKYIYCVYNFSNGSLAAHLLAKEAFYFYISFCLARFTKLKFLTLPLYFLKSFIDISYIIMLFTAGIPGGIIVAIFVFLPSMVISLSFQFIVAESSGIWNKKYSLAVPIVFSIAECVIILLIINIIFRLVVSIV